MLLCSDGLTDFVDEPTVRARLASPGHPDVAALAMVDAALAAGGRDNITCLVCDLDDGPRMSWDGRLLGAMADPFLVVDAAAIHRSA
jgi:protein phosphatase